MAEPAKTITAKVKANSVVAAAPMGVALAFGWNGLFPTYPMSPEVAAGVAPLLGPIVRWMVAWLPDPTGGD